MFPLCIDCGADILMDPQSPRCKVCRRIERSESDKFRYRHPLAELRDEPEPFPEFTRNLRSAWMGVEAMKHRTAPKVYR